MQSEEKKLTQQEIANECREIYARISGLQDYFGWSLNTLCKEVFVEICSDADSDDTEEARKYQEKIKKILQRKNWELGTVTQHTLGVLKELEGGIYLTEEYCSSKWKDSKLSKKTHKTLKKISADIQKNLLKNDYEE